MVLAPLAWVALEVLYVHIERTTETIASGIQVSPDPEIAVVVLQAPDAFLERYLSFQRRVMGLPTPRVWRTLSLAPYSHRLTRTGTSSFELEVVDGHWMSSPFETLFRRATNPLLPGDSVDLGDMQADILEVDEVGPTRVKFRFDRSLDDHSLQFFAWQNQRMERFSMPPVGGQRLIAWEPGPAALW